MSDTRIVGDGQNQGPINAAHVRALNRANALLVAQVNISGDIVNPGAGGGAASNVNLNQVAGNSTSVGSGTTDSGTLRVVVASDDTVPVSIAGTVNVSGSTSANPVGVSGDVSTKPLAGQTWPVSIAGTVAVSGATSANPVGISGDVSTFQKGAWATAVTGDVLLRANPLTVIGQLGSTIGVNVIGGSIGARISASGDLTVREQAVLGVQIVGGGQARVSISGDSLNVVPQGLLGVYLAGGTGHGTAGVSGDVQVKQAGAWAVAVTGDILLRANPSVVIGQIGGTVGVNVIGGSVGARISASGDLTIAPSTTNFARIPVSGDTAIVDGSNVTIRATVKSFTRSNPLAVQLVNSSGDGYNAGIDQPIPVTAAGRITSAGSAQIVAAVAGKKIKVFSYSLQGDGDNARGFFASGASGTQLTLEWELASREGVAKQIGAENSQALFSTTAGAALSFESSSSRPMKYDVGYHAEDAI